MSTAQSGKTNQIAAPTSTKIEDYTPPVRDFPANPLALYGAICTTTFYGKECEVAVLGTRDAQCQEELLVKVQLWDGNKMVGKTSELSVGWLSAPTSYWIEEACPFDDEIPF